MIKSIKKYFFQGLSVTWDTLVIYYIKLLDRSSLKQTLSNFIKERGKGLCDPEWQHYLTLHTQIEKLEIDRNLNFSAHSAPLLKLKLTVTKEGLLDAVKPNSHTLPIRYTRFEAYTVAKAIYQLAYSHTTNPHSKKSENLKKAIDFFLMRPFAKLYPTEEVLMVLNLYRELEFSFTRYTHYLYAYPTAEAIKNHSAVTIQRQFRKHRQEKRVVKNEEMSDTLKSSMHSHFVSEHPVPPPPFMPPSKEIKEQWLNKQGADEEFYKKVLSNLVYYRSHEKFLKQLLHCVHDFNKLLASLPSNLHDYAIVVPVRTVKSNHWVTALALPTLEKKPKVILFPHEVQEYVVQNPSVKHFVFFDDAVYSGRQMSKLIQKAKIVGSKYTLVAPYYTKNCLVKLDNDVDNYILGERMLRAEDLESKYSTFNSWRKKDSESLGRKFSDVYGSARLKVGVFFQHITADIASTFLSDLKEIIPDREDENNYRQDWR